MLDCFAAVARKYSILSITEYFRDIKVTIWNLFAADIEFYFCTG